MCFTPIQQLQQKQQEGIKKEIVTIEYKVILRHLNACIKQLLLTSSVKRFMHVCFPFHTKNYVKL